MRFLTAISLAILLAGYSSASPNWPNEQAGSTVLSDWGFGSNPGGGWTKGYAGQIVSDASAPLSPPSVWRNKRDANGNYGDNLRCGVPGSYPNEVYFGFWFKPSNPMYGWFGVYQKLALINSGAPHIYFRMTAINQVPGTFLINMVPEGVNTDNIHITGSDLALEGNMSNPRYPLGQWYRAEIHVKRSSTYTSRDGILKWWVNGTLCGSYTNLNFGSTIKEVLLCSIWDAVYPALPYAEWIDYDHARVSLPPGIVPPLAISTSELPAGKTGTNYVTTLAASGGVQPFTWELVSGTVPAGLKFYSTGFLSGTPTESKTVSLSFKVTDATNVTATKTLSLAVTGQSGISSKAGSLRTDGMTLIVADTPSRVMFQMQFAAIGEYSIAVFDLQGRDRWHFSGTGANSATAIWNHGGKLEKGVYLVRANQSGKTLNATYCQIR